MSQRRRRYSRQFFAWTGEFGVHYLYDVTIYALHFAPILYEADNAMDVSLRLKSMSRKIPENLVKLLETFDLDLVMTMKYLVRY